MSRPLIGRRRFLQGVVAGASAIGLGVRPGLAADVSGRPSAGKIGEFKISLAEWSLHKALRKKEITNLDFPGIAREKYGIDAVEFVNQFFKDKAHDSAYLKELKKRADDNGVTCVLIMIDGEGDLASTEKSKRDQAVDNHKAWVDAAAELGCHSIRVNTSGGAYSPGHLDDVAGACSKLAEFGASKGINIIVENHGGSSSDPTSLVALMKQVNSARFGTLPDFGNFPKNQGIYTIDVYDAIARMMPFAKGVSAKTYDFKDDGGEEHLDFARILKIVTDAGYKGYVGIEYEGDKLPEPDGILATKKLLEKLRGSMYSG